MRLLLYIVTMVSFMMSCKFQDPEKAGPAEEDVEMIRNDSSLLIHLQQQVKDLKKEANLMDSVLANNLWPAWSPERYETTEQYVEVAMRSLMVDTLQGVGAFVATRQNLKDKGNSHLIVFMSGTDSIGTLSIGELALTDVTQDARKSSISKEYEMLRNHMEGGMFVVGSGKAGQVLNALNDGGQPIASTGSGTLTIPVNDSFLQNLKALGQLKSIEKEIASRKKKIDFLREKWVGKLG